MGYDAVVDRLPASCLVEIQGGPSTLREVVQEASLAVPSEPNTWSSSGNVTTAWVGQRRWLVIAPLAQEQAFRAAMPAAGGVVLSDAFTGFSIEGRDALDVMAQASPLDVHPARFPDHGATFTALFGQLGLVLRQPAGFACYVDASYEDYIADRFSRCGARPGSWFRQFRAGRA